MSRVTSLFSSGADDPSGGVAAPTRGRSLNEDHHTPVERCPRCGLDGFVPGVGVTVARQTAGGNVGNSVSPVVVLIGISAVGGKFTPQLVLRTVLVATGVLMAVVTALTLTFIAVA